MKNLFVFTFFIISQMTWTQTSTVNSTPKKCVNTFFDYFHKKDTIGLKSIIHSEIIVGTVLHNQKDTLLKVDNAEALYKSLASIPDSLEFEEKLMSIKVREEGILAHVWTPYDFFLKGEKSHHGVNAFTLLNTGEGWKIIYLVDTRRRD